MSKHRKALLYYTALFYKFGQNPPFQFIIYTMQLQWDYRYYIIMGKADA